MADDVELPLTGHLAELRRRIAIALLAIVAAFSVCYPYSRRLFEFLEAPLRQSAEASGYEVQIVGTGVAEAFFTRIAVCAVAALFLALPVVLYQLWKFIVPGLKDTEAGFARWFAVAGTFFFLAGAAFCYRVVFPVGFPFFLQEYENIGAVPVLRISEYLAFSSRMMLAFGVTFEMPVLTYFLARAGVVTHRTLIDYSRYAVLAIFIVAAVLTPPDAASQMMMAIPLLILYVMSIGVAYVFARQPAASDAGSGTES
ncbi:MAG TPA: twin-arginine translocase subunit TatC [Candidatus Binatia bacterium]|nr:twin-arginine translocase subunit TatC [Candidatus Binatia bacterium]